MSEDNVAVVRRFWSSPLSALTDVVDDDVDYRAVEGAPDDVGVMHGRDALVRYQADWAETFADFSTELEEAEAIGEDHVLALGRVAGRARASGVETELRLAVLYTVRGGRIVRGREYMTKYEALAAASRRAGHQLSRADPDTTGSVRGAHPDAEAPALDPYPARADRRSPSFCSRASGSGKGRCGWIV